MTRLSVIGIGPGDPRMVTLEAIDAMNTVDVFFIVVKTRDTDALVELRRAILDEHVTRPHRVVEIVDPERERDPADYRSTVAAWRSARAEAWQAALDAGLGEGEHGAFLVWGDPALYDSTLDVLAEMRERGGPVYEQRVVAGISSVALLAARHAIALNRIGGAVEITPARRLAQGFPSGSGDVVVMLDSGTAFAALDEPDVHIYWGAYLGSRDELLIDGPLHAVRDEIAAVRAEAKARKGWMFDTYLLRRSVR